MNLRCEILSTGDEVLTGAVVDTNAAFLADRMGSLGFEVVRHTTVGDDRAMLGSAVAALGATADVVLCTGGLGPTVDDLTTEVVSEVLGVPYKVDALALERMEARWRIRGQPMPENNRKQAQIPEPAEVLPNPIGTAPGYTVRIGPRGRFYFMPGVPREMRQMFESEVVPRLGRHFPQPGVFEVRLFRVFGIPESAADAILAGLEDRFPGVKLGFRAHFPELYVKLTVKGPDSEACQARLAAAASEVTARLGASVFSDGSPLEVVVVVALTGAHATVATAEPFTAGRVAAMLLQAGAGSGCLLGGFVPCSAGRIAEDLGVDAGLLVREGLPSEACVRAMAEGVRTRGAATYGVATVGVARAEEATAERPLGTVLVAIAGPEGTNVQRLLWQSGVEQARSLGAMAALDLIRRAIAGLPVDPRGFGASPPRAPECR